MPGLQVATFWFWNTACMGSCASQGNCVVLGLVILRITFAICSKISLFFGFRFDIQVLYSGLGFRFKIQVRD